MINKKGRKAIVKRVKMLYNDGDFLPALGYSGNFYRTGDLVALLMANRAFGYEYGINGLYILAVLHAAEELERKTGFFSFNILKDVFDYPNSYALCKKLYNRGLFCPRPFPLDITHITRQRKVYVLSDKGKEALKYFRTEYMKHQKLSKKARLKMMESLNTF